MHTKGRWGCRMGNFSTYGFWCGFNKLSGYRRWNYNVAFVDSISQPFGTCTSETSTRCPTVCQGSWCFLWMQWLQTPSQFSGGDAGCWFFCWTYAWQIILQGASFDKFGVQLWQFVIYDLKETKVSPSERTEDDPGPKTGLGFMPFYSLETFWVMRAGILVGTHLSRFLHLPCGHLLLSHPASRTRHRPLCVRSSPLRLGTGAQTKGNGLKSG